MDNKAVWKTSQDWVVNVSCMFFKPWTVWIRHLKLKLKHFERWTLNSWLSGCLLSKSLVLSIEQYFHSPWAPFWTLHRWQLAMNLARQCLFQPNRRKVDFCKDNCYFGCCARITFIHPQRLSGAANIQHTPQEQGKMAGIHQEPKPWAGFWVTSRSLQLPCSGGDCSLCCFWQSPQSHESTETLGAA